MTSRAMHLSSLIDTETSGGALSECEGTAGVVTTLTRQS